MSDRIADGIGRMTTLIESKSADKPETILALEHTCALEHADWIALGDKSSLALASGIVTPDEAQTLYRIHTDWWGHSLSLAERVVFLQSMGEIIATISS